MRKSKPILAVICSVFASLVAAAAPESGTLTVGRASQGPGGCTYTHSGYSGDVSPLIGSYSPSGLSGGLVVGALEDLTCSPFFAASQLRVYGFSSNPGQSWLQYVSCGGVDKWGSAATFNYYASGIAVWHWPSTFGFNAAPVGSVRTCEILRTSFPF